MTLRHFAGVTAFLQRILQAIASGVLKSRRVNSGSRDCGMECGSNISSSCKTERPIQWLSAGQDSQRNGVPHGAGRAGQLLPPSELQPAERSLSRTEQFSLSPQCQMLVVWQFLSDSIKGPPASALENLSALSRALIYR